MTWADILPFYIASCLFQIGVSIFWFEGESKDRARLALASPLAPLTLLYVLGFVTYHLTKIAKLGELIPKRQSASQDSPEEEHYCINCNPKQGPHR